MWVLARYKTESVFSKFIVVCVNGYMLEETYPTFAQI